MALTLSNSRHRQHCNNVKEISVTLVNVELESSTFGSSKERRAESDRSARMELSGRCVRGGTCEDGTRAFGLWYIVECWQHVHCVRG